jgi:hypothetical protein
MPPTPDGRLQDAGGPNAMAMGIGRASMMTPSRRPSHRQPLLFDVKYPLTGKNSPPILPPLESNIVSKQVFIITADFDDHIIAGTYLYH